MFLRSVAQAFGYYKAAVEHPPRNAQTRASADELRRLSRSLHRALDRLVGDPVLSGRINYALSQAWRSDPVQSERDEPKRSRRAGKLAAMRVETARQLRHETVHALKRLEYVLLLIRGPSDEGGRPLVDAARAGLVIRLAVVLRQLGLECSAASDSVLGTILRMAIQDIEHKQLSPQRIESIIRRARHS